MSIIVSYPTVGVGCFAFVVAEKGSSAVAGGTSGTSATDSVQTTTLGKVSSCRKPAPLGSGLANRYLQRNTKIAKVTCTGYRNKYNQLLG